MVSPSPRSVTIGLIQNHNTADIAGNLARALVKIDEAASQGAQIICLQEIFQTLYFCQEENAEFFNQAESIPGPLVSRLQEKSRELAVVLIVPLFERRAPGLFHNSAAIIDADGSLLGIYRKMHIPYDPGFSEKYYFTPGDLGFKVAALDNLNLGLLICWDQWFPEAARITAMKGADILYYPTAIGWDDTEDKAVYQSQVDAWTNIMRSHAIANNVFVIAVNRVGREGHLNFWGHSFCCDPFGNIVYQDSTEEKISTVEIDLGKISEARRIWPYFRDRRVDAYADLTEKWLA